MKYFLVSFFITFQLFAYYVDKICNIPVPNTIAGKVAKVTDGDTIHITVNNKNVKIRMLSIDTAETNYNGHSQGYWGDTAAAYLAKILPIGSDVIAAYEAEQYDAYKRLLAHVYYNGNNINYTMLYNGYASMYIIYPNISYLSCYALATTYAMYNHLGIYSTTIPLLQLPFEFRDQTAGTPQDKWVGDFTKRVYVSPLKYKEIPEQNRVFFFKKEDAIASGFSFLF